MALKNFDKLVETIAADANLREYYFIPETGEACVIGGLAISCGIDPASWLIEHLDDDEDYAYFDDDPDNDLFESPKAVVVNTRYIDTVDGFDLDNPPNEETYSGGVMAVWALAEPIMETYGLNIRQLSQLQRINDGIENIEDRRTALIAKVTQWHNKPELEEAA